MGKYGLKKTENHYKWTFIAGKTMSKYQTGDILFAMFDYHGLSNI